VELLACASVMVPMAFDGTPLFYEVPLVETSSRRVMQ
jgi:hypothetical protein